MQQMQQSSQSTFQVMDQVVQAFGGLAQMLDSTFHATYSSFMAMVGVVEQFGLLRDYFSRALSLATLYAFVRRLLGWITGRPPVVATSQLNSAAFERFAAEAQAPPVSRKPLLIFLAILIGVPYLLSRAIRSGREAIQQDQQAAAAAAATGGTLMDPSGMQQGLLPPPESGVPTERARALYDFSAQNAVELTLQRGDEIDVISRSTANGQPAAWWKGRLVSNPGRVGLFPGNHVELVSGLAPAAAAVPVISADEF